MSGRKTVLAFAVLFAVAACAGDDSSTPTASPTPVRSPSPATSTAAPPTTLPINLESYSAVCTGEKYAGAAAYQGPGPHQIVLHVTAKDDPGALDDGIDANAGPLPATWATSSVTEVQLVGCVSVVSAQRLRTCSYAFPLGGAAGPEIRAGLYERIFSVDVRQARTGAKVGATVRIRSGDNACKKSVAVPDVSGISPQQYGNLTAAQMTSVFGSRVTAAVR